MNMRFILKILFGCNEYSMSFIEFVLYSLKLDFDFLFKEG